MKSYTRIYLDSIGKQPCDINFCELCHTVAVDIHHIDGRLGDKLTGLNNLVALCRSCHNKAHNGVITKEQLRKIAQERIELYERADNFAKKNRKSVQRDKNEPTGATGNS